jgi:hypothetical protein
MQKRKNLLPYDRLCRTKQVNLANENAALIYFHLKLDKTQTKAGGAISLIESGGITRNVVFSSIAK